VTATKEVEDKTARVGEGGVKLSEMKEDKEDTEESLEEDKKFRQDLDKNCKTKKAEWDVRCKLRTEELLAIADTIKILNDDDALDLFKKTLPSSSLIQVPVRENELRARALALVQQVRHSGHVSRRADLGFLALALSGKTSHPWFQ
jgi:hypothetical protein